MMKTIYVKGDILYKSKKFRYSSKSGALFDESYIAKADEVIDEDLIIGPASKDKGSIYNIYWAKGGFTATTFWDEYIPGSFESIRDVFHTEMDLLTKMLCGIDKGNGNHILFRMILVDIFSAYEYFISQVLLCKYANDEDAFHKYYKLCKAKHKKSEIPFDESKLRDHIRKNIVSNNENLSQIFKETLNIEFPKYNNKMNNYIIKRHLCVHRLGIKKDGNMIPLDENLLRCAIKEISKIVEDVYRLVN